MVDVKNNKIFNSLNFSKRQIYLCDVLDLFFLVSDKKQQVKEKSEAAKAYVSASESDSDEHEVLGMYSIHVVCLFLY